MNELTVVLTALAMSVFTIFYRLFVTVKVWSYIAIPLGAPAITMWTAFGLQILFTLVRPGHYHNDHSMKTIVQESLSKLLEVSILWGLAHWLFA